ncbi:MAG: twin-arginine translocase subunit TatC [Archaeoglobaceae archaeon]
MENGELVEHVAELRKRLKRIVLSLTLVLPLALYFSPTLIEKFWGELVGEKMYVYSPTEWILLCLVLSLVVAMIIVYPYAMLELYLFAKPGLYDSERRFLKFAIIPSYLVFLAGSYVSYKFLVPYLYSFSFGEHFYSVEKTTINAIKLSFAFGILLQIPLVVILLDSFRIVSYQTLKNLRLPIYLVLIAFLLNSPTDIGGLTQLAIILSFFIMFELSLLLLRFSKR